MGLLSNISSIANSTVSKIGGSKLSNKISQIGGVAGNIINLIGGNYSGQGYDGRAIKRMELEYKGQSWKFAINPEEITVRQPNFATLTTTKAGIWVDEWGKGVKEITISGTTGTTGNELTCTIDGGYQKFVALKKLFDSFWDSAKEGADLSANEAQIKFYNYTDCLYYYVIPTQAGVTLARSKNQPHLYRYTINLWVISDATAPKKNILETLIGNPFKDPVGSINSIVKTGNLVSTATKSIKGLFGSGTPQGKISTTTIENPDVDTNTLINSESKSWKLILEDSKRLYIRLAPYIGGDIEGKISPATAIGIIHNMDYNNQGICLTTYSAEALEPEEDDDTYAFFVRLLFFKNVVSQAALEVFNMIRDYDMSLLSSNYTIYNYATGGTTIQYTAQTSKIYNSTLYSYIQEYITKFDISKDMYNKIRMIMLDTVALYVDLYYLVNNDSKMKMYMTPIELDRLIKNVEYLSTKLEKQPTELRRFDLIPLVRELRYLANTLRMVKMDVIRYF